MTSDKPSAYSLKLSGNGLSIEKDISEELARHIAVFVLSGGKAELSQDATGPSHLGSSPPHGGVTVPDGRSPQEYLQQSGAKKAPQKITALANHALGSQKGKSNFSQSELKKAFQDAKEKVPANLRRDLAAAIRAGWVAPVAGDKDAYYVTGSGIAAIGAQFPTSAKKRKKRKKSKPASKTK